MGARKISSLNFTNFKIDGGVMFGVIPKMLWHKKYPADEDNLCSWALRSLLIDDGTHLTLIDNGFGTEIDQKTLDHYHLFDTKSTSELLAEKGYKPEDVTDMVITHLHLDHCGGGVTRNTSGTLVTAFPNATYHVSKAQWEWASNPNQREKDAYFPEHMAAMKKSGRLNLVENEGPLLPGIEVRLYHGHTRGQMLPFIQYNGKTIVFVSDLLPAWPYIRLPWIMSYDVEPMITLEEKENFLQEAVEKDYILYYQHDFTTECSTLKKTAGSIAVGEKFQFSELAARE